MGLGIGHEMVAVVRHICPRRHVRLRLWGRHRRTIVRRHLCLLVHVVGLVWHLAHCTLSTVLRYRLRVAYHARCGSGRVISQLRRMIGALSIITLRERIADCGHIVRPWSCWCLRLRHLEGRVVKILWVAVVLRRVCRLYLDVGVALAESLLGVYRARRWASTWQR